MRKKLLCTVTAVAMLAGLFVVAAGPAQAVAPTDTQNFLPDDTPNTGLTGNPGQGDVLSDKFDGTDRLAHLTNVSTTDTAQVRWFACPDSRFTGTGQTVTANSQLQGCTELGTDTAPPVEPIGA